MYIPAFSPDTDRTSVGLAKGTEPVHIVGIVYFLVRSLTPILLTELMIISTLFNRSRFWQSSMLTSPEFSIQVFGNISLFSNSPNMHQAIPSSTGRIDLRGCFHGGECIQAFCCGRSYCCSIFLVTRRVPPNSNCPFKNSKPLKKVKVGHSTPTSTDRDYFRLRIAPLNSHRKVYLDSPEAQMVFNRDYHPNHCKVDCRLTRLHRPIVRVHGLIDRLSIRSVNISQSGHQLRFQRPPGSSDQAQLQAGVEHIVSEPTAHGCSLILESESHYYPKI